MCEPFIQAAPPDLAACDRIMVGPPISMRIGLKEAPEAITNPARGGEIRVLVVSGGK
ncbi:hypothetical protein [Rhizobium leguminosarum]|uniref:hypothetical protein n=1 Tax=Rhizobium leguminosarum TaxID=384 RepID=UPI00396562AD